MAEIQYVKDSFDSYLGNKKSISASDCKNFMKSPMYYYFNKYEEKKVIRGRHFAVGSALHESILEPHKFFDNYVIQPKFDLRTKAGKEGFELFDSENKGKVLLTQDEMEMITKICESALKNQTLMELISDSHKELSIYTTDDITGLNIKLRPDIYSINKSTITDLKSCMDSSPKAFKGNVYSFGYSLTNAFYCDFAKKENYVFAALEKESPYQVTLYQLSDEMIEYGRQQYRTALDLLKWSYDNNYWCDYSEFILLKECYELGNLSDFFEIKKDSTLIHILN